MAEQPTSASSHRPVPLERLAYARRVAEPIFLRFLQEFEYRCAGVLKSSESAAFCTESCCWQDALSCTLHTPRQQNGYDCGVFVVEYVYFLTQNLNAIETLLCGPSRDAQAHHRVSSYSPRTPVATGAMAPEGRHGDIGLQPESDGSSRLLETTLGFRCPCMTVKGPTAGTKGASWAPVVPSHLKARLTELKHAKAAILGTAAAEGSAQQLLYQQPFLHPSPRDGKGAFGQLPLRNFTAEKEPALTQAPRPAAVPSTALQIPLVEASPVGGCRESTAIPSSRTLPTVSVTSCPPWGPLPHSFSKRRSAHAKWFSQDRVTRR